jgi:hypothetical protein
VISPASYEGSDMAGEILARWERFVTDPIFKRYGRSAKELRALFESIGEDLASSSEEIRKIAFWALVYAMPKLASILHERETRQPGWRDIEGTDQRAVNQGSDILSDLHREFVVEQRFKIRGENDKDPRAYVNSAIRNREIDEQRKREREVLLDYDATLTIPDPARSLEDTIIENEAYEDWKREFRRFLKSDDESDMLITALVDDTRISEVLESIGIPYGPAERKRFSRARNQAVELRDQMFGILLIFASDLRLRGKLPQSSNYRTVRSFLSRF